MNSSMSLWNCAYTKAKIGSYLFLKLLLVKPLDSEVFPELWFKINLSVNKRISNFVTQVEDFQLCSVGWKTKNPSMYTLLCVHYS